MSEVRQTRDRVTGAIEFAVKVIALGVPIFYAMGRLYFDGYWTHLGLSTSLMAPSAEDYLYLGFLSVLLPLARLVGVEPYTPMGYAVLIGLGLALLAVIARLIGKYFGGWAKSQIGAYNDRLTAWAKEREFFAKQVLLLASVSTFVAFVLIGLIYCVLFLILPLALAVKEGQYQAAKVDAWLRDPLPAQSRNEAKFSVDGAAHSAPLLTCSDQWCVVLMDKAYVAVPAEAVVRVRVVTPPKKLPAAK